MIRKILGATIAATGYGSVERSPREREYLVRRRGEANARHITDTRQRFVRLLEDTKAQYDDYAAGLRPDPPIIDFLIVSGGGDWGAFGAGFLKGWGSIPKTDAQARPEFDIVTGVSTGALIAPFAFLGDTQSYEQIVHLYRNPHPDWVKQRGYLYFLPNNISFAEVPGLERELRSIVTLEMATRLAGAEKSGRMLVVNTTNLDDASPRVFHLVSEARRAIQTGDLSRLHSIMLASAGIPGAFPLPRDRRRDVCGRRGHRQHHLRWSRRRGRQPPGPFGRSATPTYRSRSSDTGSSSTTSCTRCRRSCGRAGSISSRARSSRPHARDR